MPRVLIAVPLAAALAFGACGGVSREEFADRLDEICRDLEDQTEDIAGGVPGTSDEIADRLDELRAAVDRSLDRMRDLERPDGEAGERAEAYVDEVERTVEERIYPALDALEAAIRTDAERDIEAATRRLQAVDERESQRLAEQLGADDCAENRSE